uniref:Uncharacterized protein n=1 Tax=Sinocyclocheilus anshuiensis TaxID=1608454 RepID=A0A671NCH4_9TELE
MSDLLMALVRVLEKTVNIIAHACQQEGMLFFISVVVADFKTLTDVLVQEVIKHDIGKQKKSNNYLFIFLFDGGNRLPYNIICHYYELFLKEVGTSYTKRHTFHVFFFPSTFCALKCSL